MKWYGCGCGTPIEPECTEGVMPRGGNGEPPSVLVAFRCVCDPEDLKVRRYPLVASAVRRLCGGLGLPWKNPAPLRPVSNDHPDLKAWRTLLKAYEHSIGDFIDELNRPNGDIPTPIE